MHHRWRPTRPRAASGWCRAKSSSSVTAPKFADLRYRKSSVALTHLEFAVASLSLPITCFERHVSGRTTTLECPKKASTGVKILSPLTPENASKADHRRKRVTSSYLHTAIQLRLARPCMGKRRCKLDKYRKKTTSISSQFVAVHRRRTFQHLCQA